MPVDGALLCVICEAKEVPAAWAVVPSNTRRFQHETHEVWRCRGCESVHAFGDVDLAYYYDQYPFHGEGDPGWWGRAMLASQVRRLVDAGLMPGQRILDFGCGSGHLVRALREAGFDAEGFDVYSDAFNDPSVLEATYDAIVCQDVIEHVPDPLSLLHTLGACVVPGGIIAVGTPAAEQLDLERPERFKHGLHQPWHRHMLSASALRHAGETLGWSVVKHHLTQYTNTWTPTANVAWMGVLIATSDGTVDAALERPTLKLWFLLPVVVWIAFLGCLLAPKTDGMMVFRTGPGTRSVA